VDSLPVWIAALAVVSGMAGVLFQNRRTKKSVKEDLDSDVEGLAARVDKVDDSIVQIKEQYMSEKEHELVCKNTSLEIKAHLSSELTDLKDAVFDSLREMSGKLDTAIAKKPNGDREIALRLTAIETAIKDGGT